MGEAGRHRSSAGWIVAGLLALTLIGTLAATVAIWDCPLCTPPPNAAPAEQTSGIMGSLTKYYYRLVDCPRCGNRRKDTTINHFFWRPEK